ncbi:protein ULTRAPETALA 2-like [Typha angustifolia]|uniref:protein ULTRAPETALA 2-like n=1 Tax=Typha angustifolia TaxID=59011 RepID=UPI003C2B8B27
MANSSGSGSKISFKDEDLKNMSGLKRGDDFIEVTCGCTSRRFGDAVGKLKVFANGELEVTCECIPECKEGKMTPSAFEKHSRRETARRWKYNIWVMVNGKKVPLLKTALLKYYDRATKTGSAAQRLHRDEFVRCTMCNRQRRFRLRSEDECRAYHDAQAVLNWKCSDMPFYNITCNDEEERESRRRLRGCSRAPLCKGCIQCVCFGCKMCRFSDCGCQTCNDYMDNNEDD